MMMMIFISNHIFLLTPGYFSHMILIQHTMRYLAVYVAIFGLTAADEGPCFSHVAVSYQ